MENERESQGLKRARAEEVLLCEAADQQDSQQLASLLQMGVSPNVYDEVGGCEGVCVYVCVQKYLITYFCDFSDESLPGRKHTHTLSLSLDISERCLQERERERMASKTVCVLESISINLSRFFFSSRSFMS